MLQYELHEYLGDRGRSALDRVKRSLTFKVVLCLFVLAGGLYGYFGIENQAEPWFGAIMMATLALATPFVAGAALLAVLYVVGFLLSFTVGVAIVAFWFSIAGGAIFLGVVLVRAFLGD